MYLKAGLTHVQLELSVLRPVRVGVAAGAVLELVAKALHGGHGDHGASVDERPGHWIQGVHILEQICRSDYDPRKSLTEELSRFREVP